ncbi:MAG TPA: hypothetical protein DEB39_15160, partial [Planctomycetaceae bacterium]|nr:hypothetical protein [Planctomycetaceae bacterium]
MQPDTAFLVLIQAGEQKGFFPLVTELETTIGRAPENTIVLFDDRCSRDHASVYYQNGEWCIQDKGSRNGTGIDNRVLHAASHLLYPGCRITIGHSVLLFGCGDPTRESTDGYETSGAGGSGVFGVNGEMLRGPRRGDYLPQTIAHRSGSSFLKSDTETQSLAKAATRHGHGSAELCRLAYNLGKAEEIDQVARLALEGLLEATGADAAGLWLFPYNPSAEHAASDVRLVANATTREVVYSPISEPLVKAVCDRKEAILVNEPFHPETTFNPVGPGNIGPGNGVPGNIVAGSGATGPARERSTRGPSRKKNAFQEGGETNNTLAAPIRHPSGFLGLVHLYTVNPGYNLDLNDLEYTLAVADTVAVAIAHVHKQKELAANLHQARKENSTLREMLKMESEIIGTSPPMKMIGHLISRAAEGKATLLICGESGVGKELVARAVHLASARKAKPFICLNCAAISESLLASELFGHE